MRTSIVFLFLVVFVGMLSSTIPLVADPDVKAIDIPTESLGRSHRLIGPLGLPLGEVVTLTMKVEDKVKKGYFPDHVTVTSIDEKDLERPVKLPARLWGYSQIKELVPGRALTVRGYQDGGMVGLPAQVFKEETFYAYSETHRFVTWLVVVNELTGTE